MNPKSLFRTLSFILIFCMSLAGCKKEEGLGGTSTIKGKVIVYDFDAAFQNPAPSQIYPATNKKAYIIYGADKTTYDNDFSTSYDGTYEFKYLQKGKYRLFAYTKDTTGAFNGTYVKRPEIPTFIDVEITSNGSTVDAPDIIILDNNN
jgi:hypothetical protein